MQNEDQAEILWDQKIPMSDGVKLSCDIYGLRKDEKRPVILLRTPYGKTTDKNVETGRYFASKGFIFIASDVRGRGDSDGSFLPYIYEGSDGYDSIEWAGTQPWSTGSVGTYGASYSGRIQWYAALKNPPHLRAMISIVAPSDPFVEDPTGITSPMNLSWEFLVSGRVQQNLNPIDWDRIYEYLPLKTMDEQTGRIVPNWRSRFDHPVMDEHTDRMAYQTKMDGIRVPVLHISGWYDDEQIGTPLNFSLLKNSKNSEVASNQMLLMGPWGHNVNTTSVLGGFDFGPGALIDLPDFERRWFERYLKGKTDEFSLEKPVRIFLMGRNEWRSYRQWPPETTEKKSLYLTSGGRANGRFGDGKLTFDGPEYEKLNDSYTYDPADPVPFASDYNYAQIGGPDDYGSVERRDDILIYSTGPLEKDVDVIGPVKLKLFVSTSAEDTDFTGKLMVAFPNGKSIRLCDGVVRMRHRSGNDRVEKTVPNEMYEVEVNMWNTSYTFSKGTSIRLEVSSSAFPKYARNLNVAGDQSMRTDWAVADQKVFHGKSCHSRLEMFFVTREGEGGQ